MTKRELLAFLLDGPGQAMTDDCPVVVSDESMRTHYRLPVAQARLEMQDGAGAIVLETS